MLDTKTLWRLRQTNRSIKIIVDKWTTNRKMEWPFFSNLMLGCNNIIGNDQFINLQYVVLSQDNTKLAVLFDFDKNYTHKNGDTSTRSKVAVYDIQKGKITEFTANNETKPFFSCDGTIIVVGAPVPYNANPPVARSFGVLICDLIGATKENKAVPSHHFKRQRFLNVHFVTLYGAIRSIQPAIPTDSVTLGSSYGETGMVGLSVLLLNRTKQGFHSAMNIYGLATRILYK